MWFMYCVYKLIIEWRRGWNLKPRGHSTVTVCIQAQTTLCHYSLHLHAGCCHYARLIIMSRLELVIYLSLFKTAGSVWVFRCGCFAVSSPTEP